MVKCYCVNGPKITPAERLMADAEGLDPLEVHKFMDTWERYADKALDLPAEEYEALYNQTV